MKRFALLSMLFLPLATMAQKQYFLPTASSSASLLVAAWLSLPRCLLTMWNVLTFSAPTSVPR